jgi:phospholipid/cholesterol/gamma-HCH transport system substrate-binding protein
MESKSHAMAAGLFVLVVAALTLVLAIWLSRDTGESHLFDVSTRETITGLQPQAAVRFRGLAVGRVESIGFDTKVPGNVLVRLSVDAGAPLTTATFATLGYQGVTGLAFVQLDDDGVSKAPLTPNDADPPRIPLRQGLVGRLTDQGTLLVDRVTEGADRVNQLLSDPNQKAFAEAVQQLGAAARGVEKLTTQMGTVLDAQFGPDRVSIPALVKDTRATMQSLQAAANETSRTAAEVGKTATELTTAAGRLNEKGGMLDRLNEGADALAAGAQTLNATTLPRLNRATDETARVARQAGRAVSNINDNPQSLLFGNGPPRPGPGEPGFAPPAPAR